MSLQGPLPMNCAAHTRAGESLKHASTHGGGAGEERQAAFDSFKDRSITKQTASENRIRRPCDWREYTQPYFRASFPCLYWKSTRQT